MLNPDQDRVVQTSNHCVVLACPGSGKTKTIVSKIGAIIRGNPSAMVCAVSFTRDSAHELKERVVKEFGHGAAKQCMISTFHALAIKQLKDAGPTKTIVSPGERNEYILRAVRQAKMDLNLEAATRAIEHLKTQVNYQPTGHNPEDALLVAYKNLLARNSVMDFHDMIADCVRGLQTNSIKAIPFTHLLADEFQDADEYQLEFVMEYLKRGAVTTVVGDDDQTIYAWRSAMGYKGMMRFAELASADKITLGINYRCHAEILATADRLIMHNAERVPKELKAERGAGGHIAVANIANERAEARMLCHVIAERAARDAEGNIVIPKGQWAVLSRSNQALMMVEAEMKIAGIPYYKAAKKEFWEESPVSLLLSFLCSLQTGHGAAIDQILHYCGVSTDDLNLLRGLLGDDLGRVLRKGLAIDLGPFTAKARPILSTLFSRGHQWATQAHHRRFPLALAGVKEWILPLATSKRDGDALTIAVESLEQLKGSFIDIKNELTRKDDAPMGDRVHLLTMHGSKGLEYQNVWIIGASEGTMPSPDSPLDEERRLMYVAMTRAKDNLFVSYIRQPGSFLVEAGLLQY